MSEHRSGQTERARRAEAHVAESAAIISNARDEVTSPWAGVLDSMASAAEELERCLVRDEPVSPAPFVPPTDLGPIPAWLRPRAVDVLRTLGELEAVVAARQRGLVHVIRQDSLGDPRRADVASRMVDWRV